MRWGADPPERGDPLATVFTPEDEFVAGREAGGGQPRGERVRGAGDLDAAALAFAFERLGDVALEVLGNYATAPP